MTPRKGKLQLPHNRTRTAQSVLRWECDSSRAQKNIGKSFTSPAICILLVAAVALVFAQTARFEFVNYDDGGYVFENDHVEQGITPAGIAWSFAERNVTGNWHPLTWLSLMLDSQFYGTARAGGFHLTNVLLHAANSVLLYLVLRYMTGRVWPCALSAALFAIHPMHVESVAWVTERKDVLSGLFGLLAIWAYVRYVRRPSVARYLPVVAALTLGLMAKVMLVTWPLLFLLLDYWPLRRPLQAWLLLEKVPLLLLSGEFVLVAFLALRSGVAVVPLELAPMHERIARAAVVYAVYLEKTFWPAGLAVYPAEELKSYTAACATAALLALITAGSLWAGRREARWLSVGWFWYLLTLSPAIGLVQVGTQVQADRFVYLPQIGLCVALAWSASYWIAARRGPNDAGRPRWPRPVYGLAASLCLALLAVCAWRQTSFWRDSETLWTHALACSSDNVLARDHVANILVNRGQLDASIAQCREALKIKPQDHMAHGVLGRCFAARGDYPAAIAEYRTAIAADPNDAKTHVNLATALAACNQFDDAIVECRTALEIAPDLAAAHNNLGRALAGIGQTDEAVAEFRRALEIRPDYALAQQNLRAILSGRGRFDDVKGH
jgi:tetratricopeptide (TPR) repeat protein